MCENTYVACGHCNARADEHVRLVGSTVMYESWYEKLDEDGDPVGDREYGDTEPGDDGGNQHYECDMCGQEFGSLDTECEPEDCHCNECEPDIENYDDPDQIVTLVRSNDRRVTNDPDWPVEVQRLVLDRSIHFVPMRRERAAEIQAEVDFTIGMVTEGYTSDPDCPCLHWDPDPQLADWIIEQLSIPEPEPEPGPVHIPGQLELEGGSYVSQ